MSSVIEAQRALRGQRDRRLALAFESARVRVQEAAPSVVEGRLTRVTGLMLEAVGWRGRIGSRCQVLNEQGEAVESEVVGFSGPHVYLMPVGEMRGVMPQARVVPQRGGRTVPGGDGLLGRVIDGEGRPLDGLGPLRCDQRPMRHQIINPLAREPITEPLDVGVRAINALMTVGRGQRLGLFAGTGVGKSTLLGMMTRYTQAEIIVVGLIGERGREVRDFIDHSLGEHGLRRAVVVATPADRSPIERLRGAWLATAIAERYRAEGRHVLLLMDSITRVAQAQREIGLAVGEPPTTRGYPPSVFTLIPQLAERAGNGTRGQGSVTAFYTVLTEGDDPQDPIADAARGVLDGHILLSRAVAESGVYPALDVESSLSRLMTQITPSSQQQLARKFRQLVSSYQRNRDLIAIGAYRPGSDPRVDEALAFWPRIENFLRQDVDEACSHANAVAALAQLFKGHATS